jgi:hypothetical protein
VWCVCVVSECVCVCVCGMCELSFYKKGGKNLCPVGKSDYRD